MLKNIFAETKNSYRSVKDKSYGSNEVNSMNNLLSSRAIRKQLTMKGSEKSNGSKSKTDKEKNKIVRPKYSNKRKSGKSVFVQSNNKKETLNVSNGKNSFKNLLNECLLNITQQANRRKIASESYDNITKANKKFLKEYKLNYLNSKASCLRSSSLNTNFKQNKLADNKNNNKNRKSFFHRSNSLKKTNIKLINPTKVNSKFILKDEQTPKIHKINSDDIKINSFTNIIYCNSDSNNSNIISSGIQSKSSTPLSNKQKSNLSKKKENRKSSSKKAKTYKLKPLNCYVRKSVCELDKKKLKIKSLRYNDKLKFKIRKHASLPEQKNFQAKKKLAMPKYLKNSTIINKENIANLPFLNDNLSNEDLAISSNLKKMIEKNISDFKNSSFASSLECEDVKNFLKERYKYNAKLNTKSPKSNLESSNIEIIEKNEKNEINNTKAIKRNNKKIKEEVNADKNNNNKNNFLLEISNALKLLNEQKNLPENSPTQANNSTNNSPMNDHSNSQIVLLNRSNQKSNVSPHENNESKKGQANNNVFFREVNSFTSMNKKALMKLEVFRNLERKNIVYDSLDDEEIDEFDENNICFNPNSFYVITLDAYIAFSTIFNTIMIPLHLARNKRFCSNSIFGFQNCIIYFNDFIYFIDVIVGFFKMYYNFEEQLITDHSTIINHYLKGNFAFDLISAIPSLSLEILKKPKCTVNNVIKFIHKYFDCKLNNLSDLWKLLKIIKIVKILKDNAFIKFCINYIDKFDVNEKIITLITYMIVAIPSLHFATCLNIFISRNSFPNWINSLNVQNESFSKIYLISLYHIITSLTTVGYGDITPSSFTETVFQLIILLIGIVAYSWLISSVSNYIKTSNEKYIEYENKLRILEDIKLKNPKIPDDLYHQILRHLRYGKKKGKNDNGIIFEILPYSLKNSLIYEMYKPIINNFTIFKNSQNSDFVISTIMALKPFSAGKNDLIIKFGDIFEEMIFVKRGKLSIEICINKKYRSKIIEAYLNDPLLHDEKIFRAIQKQKRDSNTISKTFGSTILNNENFNSMKYSTISPFKKELNSTNKVSSFQLDKDLTKYKSNDNIANETKDETDLKILDIRQNEYFGDILMFLGYKSPFNIRAKSKKTELFLLRKVDAINISLAYKNIWNRINEKSTSNIEQIKIRIQKAVKQYCQFLGIKKINNKNITNNINTNDSKIESNKSINPNSLQSTILCESNDNKDKSLILSKHFNSAVSSSQINKTDIHKTEDQKDKNNNYIKSIFSNKKNEKIEKIKNSSSLNFESSSLKEKESSKTIENLKLPHLFKLSNKFDENYDVISIENNKQKKLVNSSCTLKNTGSNASNNAKNLSNDRRFPNHNNEQNITPFKSEEVNDEIYPGEIFEIEINKNFGDKKDFLSKVKDNNHSFHDDGGLNKIKDQKKSIKENDSNEKNKEKIKEKYSNNILIEAKNFSLEYKSTYDNLNQLTKYQYSKDSELQSKTKIFLEGICFNKGVLKTEESNNNSLINSKIIKKKNITNNVKDIKGIFSDGFSNMNKGLSSTKNHSYLNKCSTYNICTGKNSDTDNNNSSISKNINNYSRITKRKGSSKCISSQKLEKVNKYDSNKTIKSRKSFFKTSKKISLFGKSGFPNNSYLSMSSLKKSKKMNKTNKLLNMVNKNIIQDSQNINNPEMFYSDLFSCLMKKQKKSEGTENGNEHNITQEEQSCELSYINNKENTFSRFQFSPILTKHSEFTPNLKRNRNKKRSIKGYA